jgi:hypothetical protein
MIYLQYLNEPLNSTKATIFDIFQNNEIKESRTNVPASNALCFQRCGGIMPLLLNFFFSYLFHFTHPAIPVAR